MFIYTVTVWGEGFEPLWEILIAPPVTAVLEENITASQENITPEVVEEIEEESLCKGCAENDICYPLGYRKEKRYCNEDYKFKPQLESDLTCENNFECMSNICLNGECVSGNLLQRILNWFKSLFGTS